MHTDRLSRPQSIRREVDVGLRNHFNHVYLLMTVGLLTTATTAQILSHIPAVQEALYFMRSNMFLGALVMFSPMILTMMMFNSSMMTRASVGLLSGLFLLLSAYFGFLFSTIFLVFTGESLARVFFITAGMFAGMSIYGYTTKADLSSMRSLLYMAVFGLMLSLLVNVFMQSEILYYAISAVGVVVYTLMIAYDTQSIKETYNPAYGETANAKMAVVGALSLYLDFIMLFQYLLSFMGSRD